jgi:hypothetical protein
MGTFTKGILLINDIELNVEYILEIGDSKSVFCIALETKGGFTYGQTFYDLETNLKGFGEWISVNDKKPNKNQKVRWLMENGEEDFGWYNGIDFCTFDPNSISEITHWKPLLIN